MQNILMISINKEYPSNGRAGFPSADMYPFGYPVRTPEQFNFLSRLIGAAVVLESLPGSCCRRTRDTWSSGPEAGVGGRAG